MEEIINSVMQSPENTNPNVLRSQLQNIGGSGEDSNSGAYLVKFDYETLAVTEGTFEEAKKHYMDGNTVMFGVAQPVSTTPPWDEIISGEFFPISKYVENVNNTGKEGLGAYMSARSQTPWLVLMSGENTINAMRPEEFWDGE